MDMQSIFVHSFIATELEARGALCEIIAHLRDRLPAEEQIGAIEIALAEVVNNVVEHAYSGLPPGEVRIECKLSADILGICVSDSGKPLPGGKLPEGKPADISGPVSDLPEGGFGWFMIRTLAREIHYTHENGRNELQLTFDLIPARKQ